MASSEAGQERLNTWFPVREKNSLGFDPDSLHNYLLFKYNPALDQIEISDQRTKRQQIIDLTQFHRRT